MKGFLAFLVIVLLATLGGGAYLYFQQTEELDQTQATLAGLNDNLITLQGQLAAEQSGAAAIQAQLAAEKDRASGLESQLGASTSQNAAIQSDLNASRTRVAALEADLAAANARIASTQAEIAAELTRVTTELARANADLSKASADLSKANSDLAELRAASESAIAELQTIKNPRHFYTIEELRAWLALDDTDSNPAYASLGLAEKAFILEVKALRDGYLLPASIDADSQYIYSWNVAVIGAGIYVVTAGTDEIMFLANFDAPLAQRPLPLT